jgi:hypothetical protein
MPNEQLLAQMATAGVPPDMVEFACHNPTVLAELQKRLAGLSLQEGRELQGTGGVCRRVGARDEGSQRALRAGQAHHRLQDPGAPPRRPRRFAKEGARGAGAGGRSVHDVLLVLRHPEELL